MVGLLGLAGLVWAEETDLAWSGRVVRVVDGDTVWVERDGTGIRIRLEGIDAPERDQPWGEEATAFIRQQALGGEVTVLGKEWDRYGRLVARIVLPNGSHLNHQLVRQGLAWWYHAYSTDHALQAAQALARQEQLGLWSDAHPAPPWLWRRTHLRPRAP
ncbi:MAG: thermonuclease family protein [Magnetococcus sp. DMHC-8]